MHYIALENIRSLHNVGVILRSCSFFGIKNVILVGYSGKFMLNEEKHILHPKVKKTSLGAENDLNITFLKNSTELLNFAKKHDLQIIAVEQAKNSKKLKNCKFKENSIFVFGHEVEGVSQQILQNSKEVIEITKHGEKGSLNVSTAASIFLYELARA